MSSPGVRIALGSVYDPPDLPYPRLLVMRRWPRGIARGAVDQWEPELGPSRELLDAYRSGAVGWEEFAERYRAEVAEKPGLIRWAARMATGNGVVLLCGSHRDEECHRSLLEEILRDHIARNGAD